MKYNFVFDPASQKAVLIIQKGPAEVRIPANDLTAVISLLEGKNGHCDNLEICSVGQGHLPAL
jgi:hypothetical protein